ncbi:TolC family protein [Alteromonas sp. ASW11-19]|uniref:TolC family protein n=1 Tax=Alteromonas salexigens TaxID=2982530 RepID=A0ABT2VR94_9ALTE|nr:TolC family protein [Alteromonas salexigens]MCU7555579.1 TolC family protein [Alteromonas salexigens]
MKLLSSIRSFWGIAKVSVGVMVSMSAFVVHAETAISLEQAITLALQNDPWLHGSKLRETATEHRSVAAGALPDPTVSLSIMSVPTDSWDLDQEGMTQLKVGVTQMFPRGDSLAIKESQLRTEASKFPLLRANRKAKLKTKVSELWLDAFLAQQTIALIESDWALFEQMAEIARANYANAIGQTRQHDVIRAQLEIVQLEDRLTEQKQKLESNVARLNEWLHVYSSDADNTFNFDTQPAAFAVSSQLPDVRLKKPLILKPSAYSRTDLAREFADHPAILAIDIKREVAEMEIALAKQQYKPQWGVNASYGYRNDTSFNEDRADLFSVGVSFDVPLFTEDRKDQQVAASIADSQAIKTEKLLLTKQMISAVEQELRQLNRLRQRQSIYQEKLLKQSHEQAEATLTAYTNDDGDFTEVVRARIAELNTRISALKIDVETLKTVTRINYFFVSAQTYTEGRPNLRSNSEFDATEKSGAH